MLDLVDTRDPVAVEDEVCSIYAALFPDGDREFVRRAFGWALQCFAGRYQDYQPVDTRYHDLEHTCKARCVSPASCVVATRQARNRC